MHFRASFAVQNGPQIFSPNSSQFITPYLVDEVLKFHLRERWGFGVGAAIKCPPNSLKFLNIAPAIN